MYVFSLCMCVCVGLVPLQCCMLRMCVQQMRVTEKGKAQERDRYRERERERKIERGVDIGSLSRGYVCSLLGAIVDILRFNIR